MLMHLIESFQVIKDTDRNDWRKIEYKVVENLFHPFSSNKDRQNNILFLLEYFYSKSQKKFSNYLNFK